MAATAKPKQTCWFCKHNRHPASQCPARVEECYKCKKKGLVGKLCKFTTLVGVPDTDNNNNNSFLLTMHKSTLSTINDLPLHVYQKLIANDTYKAVALIDTGSTDKSFMRNSLFKTCKIIEA